jgi:hypothetical protein
LQHARRATGEAAMASDTELLYPGESTASEDLKIVRIARYLRELRIKTPQAHIQVGGLLSTKILLLTTEAMEKERGVVKDMLWRVRTKLLQSQLTEDAIRVYVPFSCVPIERPGQVVLRAVNAAPRPARPYMWDRQPNIQTAVGPEVEASLNMAYDLKGHEEDEKNKEKLDSLVTCQIEVAIWDAKTNNRQIQYMPDAKVTLSVGPTGIEEVGAELTAVKLKLKALNLADKFKWGLINKVEVSLKGEAGLEFKRDFEKDRVGRLFSEWQAKVKASLSFELQIPKTSLKLPIEITPYLDQEGKPGVQFQIKILDF